MNNFSRCLCRLCLLPIKYGIHLVGFVFQLPSACSWHICCLVSRCGSSHTAAWHIWNILQGKGGVWWLSAHPRHASFSFAPVPFHQFSFPVQLRGSTSPVHDRRVTEESNTAEVAGAFINWDISAWWGVVLFWKLMPEPTGEVEITFRSC